MDQFECIQGSLLNDILINIASCLQVSDICALGSCSRFWQQVCGLDEIWVGLFRERWPDFQGLHDPTEGWMKMYIKQHKFMADSIDGVINFVEDCSSSGAIGAENYQKAIEDLCEMRVGFQDVQMFILKPNLNAFINLVGLHYSIDRLKIPGQQVKCALQNCEISERQVHIKWRRRGGGGRCMMSRDDGARYCSRSLKGLVDAQEMLRLIHRGRSVEISITPFVDDPTMSN